MKSRAIAAILAVVAVVALLTFGLISEGENAISVGDPAPDKELSRLDRVGTNSLADYRGRWVLVNFWASWCDPCRTEAPALESFWREHRGTSVTVLGVNLDDATEDAVEFVEEFQLTYPQLRDGDGRERRDAYGMTGFPESFLVDPEGRLALIQRGPVDAEFLSRRVEPIVSRGEPRR